MRSDHPRSDGTAPALGAVDPDGRDWIDDDRLDRRSFLRRTAGVGAATVGVGAVGLGAGAVGDARAQQGTATTTGEGEEETITTNGAFPADAPTLGNPDFVGLLVHVAGVNQDASTRDVSGCSFVESDDAVVAYDVTVLHRDEVDPEPEGRRQADTLLFAEVNDDTVAYGKLFIVGKQESCGSGHVQVQLEEVGAANIDTADVGVETGNATVADGDGNGDATAAPIPGFGVGATVAGLLGTGELLRRRT